MEVIQRPIFNHELPGVIPIEIFGDITEIGAVEDQAMLNPGGSGCNVRPYRRLNRILGHEDLLSRRHKCRRHGPRTEACRCAVATRGRLFSLAHICGTRCGKSLILDGNASFNDGNCRAAFLSVHRELSSDGTYDRRPTMYDEGPRRVLRDLKQGLPFIQFNVALGSGELHPNSRVSVQVDGGSIRKSN